MNRFLRFTPKAALAALGLLAPSAMRAAEAPLTSAQTQFFEAKIRPVLVQHCYKCHSADADKVKGSLLLDSKEGVLKGGETGPAIVPGDPDKSLLIKSIRYTDPDLQMPPKGEKLKDEQIADLVQWVKMGAPDPRTGKSSGKYTKSQESQRAHWAFQPVKKPEVPAVKQKGWAATPVDHFIQAKLEEKGMTPSSSTDKRTLLRRATFDLIGLPPTPKEVQDFLADNSKDAFAKVVDRLLASPHYGERWGRYWLDTARYADTKGETQSRREDFRYPHAWTYRDYVIRSFNEDKPYDRFLMEQIAADKLPDLKDKWSLAALGFLTLGDRFNGNNEEVINDRIDTVTKATQALTVSCARCHDHKFDPIPTKDYYSLRGIFVSSMEPRVTGDLPIIAPKPEQNPYYADYARQRAALLQEMRAMIDKGANDLRTSFQTNAAAYIMFAVLRPGTERSELVTKARLDANNTGQMISRAVNNGGRRNDPIWGPLHEFAALSKEEFPKQAKALALKIAANNAGSVKDAKGKGGRGGGVKYNPIIARAFNNASPTSLKDVAAIYGSVFASVRVSNQRMVDKDINALWQMPFPAPPASQLAESEFEQIIARMPLQYQGRATPIRTKIAQLDMNHPGSPPRAMVMTDRPRPEDSPVFIRGEIQNRGEIVPRRYLEIIAGPDRKPFRNGSGRLELAQSIATRSNPLTARVMVNRVWLHHFGEGFVTSPDDFGLQAAPPSHPELLDWLATYFMDNGWSVKKLHRLIMLSSVYQQSSENNPRYAQIDPHNRLLWRANIRRLEFEALRDSLLAIGGRLDLRMGGQPVNLNTEPYSTRRTIYGFIDRGNLPEVLNHFDFANPSLSTGKRYDTIVPQQALFFMNSPLVVEQARNLVNRPDFLGQQDIKGAITLLYELIYQRPPKPEELKLGMDFLATSPLPNRSAPVAPVTPVAATKGRMEAKAAPKAAPERRSLSKWESYAHTLLIANEMSYVN